MSSVRAARRWVGLVVSVCFLLGADIAHAEPQQPKPSQAEQRKQVEQRIERDRQTRQDRRKAEKARVMAQWGPVLLKPGALAEVQTNAERVARLRRIMDVAELTGKKDVLQRASKALARESKRHEQAMRAFHGGMGAMTSPEYKQRHTRRQGLQAPAEGQ